VKLPCLLRRLLAVVVSCLTCSTPVLAFRADELAGPLRNMAPPLQIAASTGRVSAAQLKLANDAQTQGVAVRWHSRDGTPVSVRGRDLGKRRSFSGGQGLVLGARTAYGQNAAAILDNLSGLYRIRDAAREFSVMSIHPDALRFQHVKMAQRYEDLRVVGGELLVHFDGDGQAYEVNGRYVPDLNLPVVPKIQAGEAVRAAQRDLAGLGVSQVLLKPGMELVVFALLPEPALAYEMIFSTDDPLAKPGRWRYWVDANRGEIIRRYNDIRRIAAPTGNGSHATITGSLLQGEGGASVNVTGWFENTGNYYLYSKPRYWYVVNRATSGFSDNNTYAYRETAGWDASDRAEMSAANNFDLVQTFFKNVLGRNSFDNSNAYARANVHEGVSYVNAYWDGADFHFGDGDGIAANELVVLDVCGHEYTHAVTENTANLEYYSESGALNESFSDILGTAIEFSVQPDGRALYPDKSPGAADWLIGEDCWIETKALRDMRNPRNSETVGSGNEQPSRYHGTYWYSGVYDNGGVHYNSGVQNFVFYLLSEGGSGNNDGTNYNVIGIGITNAEKIAYRALTVYCGQHTDYPSAPAAWLSAAQDLNAAWVASVQAAWDAVGVGSGSSSGDAWDPGDNTGEGATELVTPTSLEQSHGPHTLSASDSYDWYEVYLSAGVRYNFNTIGGNGDNYGELYRDATTNNRVAFDDDAGGNMQFSLSYTSTVSRWYYLRVRAYYVGRSASYTLKYRVTGGSSGTDLATALDATTLSWITGGSGNWVGETIDAHDGVDAARSGVIGDNQLSWAKTTAQGPGLVSFWWKVSSERNNDFLIFYRDGVERKRISGEVTWQNEIFTVPAGSHTLTWSYVKNHGVSTGSDAGWLDQVVWTAASPGATKNDFDGDGQCDVGCYYDKTGTWYIFKSSEGFFETQFGYAGTVPVTGDFDGDGKTDIGCYYAPGGNWYVFKSTEGFWQTQFGYAGTIPLK
jgi:Zn-dependent metalloprotease